MANKAPSKNTIKKGPSVFSLLTPYRGMVFLLIFFALLSNGINLVLPKIIANGIDAWPKNYVLQKVLLEFLGASVIIFIFTYLQGVVQVYTSEKVARDLRSQLSYKISIQSYAYVEESNPSKLLTNLTADVDSIESAGNYVAVQGATPVESSIAVASPLVGDLRPPQPNMSQLCGGGTPRTRGGGRVKDLDTSERWFEQGEETGSVEPKPGRPRGATPNVRILDKYQPIASQFPNRPLNGRVLSLT
jgi:hypothetical protein